MKKSLLFLLFAALLGCENEEHRQHHLYNLQKCVEETYGADEFALTPTGDKEIEAWRSSQENQQRNHDHRAAECMAELEKTTIEYQQAKHDDYGKVKPK
jgi:hypothetical protein